MKLKLLILPIALLIITNAMSQVYMYGTTSEGGANNLGTIYRIDESGQNFQKLFDFTTSTGGTPFSGLTLANGKLYGFTTTDGQIVNNGAVIALGSFYEFDPLTNNLNVIEYIDDQSNIGNRFFHSPILSSDGLLYFVSSNSGLASTDGILSSFNPSNSSFSVLDTFTTLYGQPQSKLLEASDNNLYITTKDGGANGFGAVVTFNKVMGSLDVLHSSVGGALTNNEYDNALNNTLFEASNGVLYGCSQSGGVNGGVVFKINKDGTGYQTLFEMAEGSVPDEGWRPEGGFIELNGILYSSTAQEDIINVNSGTLFTVDISSNVVNFIHTLDLEGSRPKGVLTESSNGRFYLTCNGGSLDNGSIIEYNPVNSSVVQRHAFNNNDGVKPQYDELCVVDVSILSVGETSIIDDFVKTYPNPVQDIINIKISGSNKIEAIKILDLKGSELYLDESKIKESVINTSFLSSGVYLLYIKTNTGSRTRKIIKE